MSNDSDVGTAAYVMIICKGTLHCSECPHRPECGSFKHSNLSFQIRTSRVAPVEIRDKLVGGRIVLLDVSAVAGNDPVQ